MTRYRSERWPLPERELTGDKKPRRLGLEIEYIGVDIRKSVELVRERMGGEEDVVSDYEIFVRDTELGDIRVELDFGYLKKVGRKETSLDKAGAQAAELAESALAEVAKRLVPVEIVGPPVPFADLWKYNDLLSDLRQAGARGTRHSPHYAFGVHLNPELPGLDEGTVLAYLQAFVCLHDWIREKGRVDLSRRITPYIDPFEKDYLLKLLDADYAPDMSALIDDYLDENPTRNRAMDMLPLFAHLDEERVRARVDDDRVQARPTLHYRLPNCQVDEPDWSLTVAWRHWLQVEALANDEDRLASICEAYREGLKKPGGKLLNDDWAQASAEWLVPELL